MLVVDHDLAEDATLGARDTVDGQNARKHRLGHGRRAAEVLRDRLARRDRDIEALRRGREDVVEGPVDRVREDEGARDQRDADHNGGGGQRGAQAARAEALDRERAASADGAHEVVHGVAGNGGGVVRDLPSASTTTRSAIAAAFGSWVTITTVWPKSSTARRSSASTSALAFGVQVAGRLVGEHDRGRRVTSARATATRCCWPPESSDGRW